LLLDESGWVLGPGIGLAITNHYKAANLETFQQEVVSMKKLSMMLAMVLVVAMVSLVAAGPGGMGCGMGMGGGMGRGMGPGCAMGPGAWEHLNLSAEQQSKAQALWDAHQKEVTPIQNQLFAKRNDLRLLWNEANPDATQIKAKQKEIGDLHSQMRDKGTQFQLDFRKLLTPEQQTKLIASGGMGRGQGPHHRGIGN
jgi:Spy/CpxP family protein refolding chaperone